jgi:hypothetical protein
MHRKEFPIKIGNAYASWSLFIIFPLQGWYINGKKIAAYKPIMHALSIQPEFVVLTLEK